MGFMKVTSTSRRTMWSRDGLQPLSDGLFKTFAGTAGATRAQPDFFDRNKSKVANMCQHEHIKGSVDEPTLLSNAHQRKEKGSATHETELLHEGLITIEKHHAIALQRKCVFMFPLRYQNYSQYTNNIILYTQQRSLKRYVAHDVPL